MGLLESLMMRPGMPDTVVLNNIINDCTQDLKDMLHVDIIDDTCDSIMKDLVLIKINHDGTEGITSESHSGISTSYMDDLPKSLRRRINSRRKLPG